MGWLCRSGRWWRDCRPKRVRQCDNYPRDRFPHLRCTACSRFSRRHSSCTRPRFLVRYSSPTTCSCRSCRSGRRLRMIRRRPCRRRHTRWIARSRRASRRPRCRSAYRPAAFKVQVFGARAAATAASGASSDPDAGWVGLRSSAQAARARAPSGSTSWMSGERNIGLLLGRTEATGVNLTPGPQADLKRVPGAARGAVSLEPRTVFEGKTCRDGTGETIG